MTNAAEIAANLDQATFAKIAREFETLSFAMMYRKLSAKDMARYNEILEILEAL
jgi:hypothetical protein